MMINVTFRQLDYDVLPKQKETWDKYCKIVQWGRRHPTRFVETFLNLQLTDYQKYIFLNSWSASTAVILCSRGSGKSFLSAPFIMTRSLLIPNHVTYIISVSGGQSSATFSKMEDLANNNIASAIGVSSVFLDNVKKANSKVSGFTHSKDGCHVELFNGSEVTSLNSVPDNLRGARASMNCFDEAAFIPKELFTATLPFTAVSSDFRTSKGLNAELYPQQLPNLNMFLSSASDTTSEMYAQYKEAFRQMMLGNTSYFVADLNFKISTAPFLNGKPMKPLVSMDEVERMYQTQPYKAEREKIA